MITNLKKALCLITFCIGLIINCQSINLPEDQNKPVKIFDSEEISTTINLQNSKEKEIFYFNFFVDNTPEQLLSLIKTQDGFIIDPLKSAGKEMEIKFYQNDNLVYKDALKGGPNLSNSFKKKMK